MLRLFSASMLSRWGFNDGDMPDEVLDYCEERGLSAWQAEWHAVLERLVRERLLPALDQRVTVVCLVTSHNPVRASTVDGADAEVYWHGGCAPRLTPEYVEIPMREVFALIQERTVAR